MHKVHSQSKKKIVIQIQFLKKLKILTVCQIIQLELIKLGYRLDK